MKPGAPLHNIKLQCLTLFAMLTLAENVAAQSAKVIYDPPLQFNSETNEVCPKKLREAVEISLSAGDGSAPVMTAICRPIFESFCLVEPFRDEEASLVFDVDSEGKPRNVRLRSITNACLSEYAGLSVILSEFEASPQGSKDVSWTARFQFDDAGWTKFEKPIEFKFKKRPRCPWPKQTTMMFRNFGYLNWGYNAGLTPETISRCPPTYPEKCMGKAHSFEAVLVHFDVSAEGRVENIRVPAATNKCLTNNAARSVASWEYAETDRAWPNLSTVITFELQDG